MEDVKNFFFKHYGPQNATLVIGGNVEFEDVKSLVTKYYADIPARDKYTRHITPEPKQTETRRLNIDRKVPANAIYMSFRMGNRLTRDHYLGDITSDVLSGGKSSRLYMSLVKDKKLFTNISAYILGGIEDGIFLFSGHLMEGVDFETAEESILNEIEILITKSISDNELTKVKNKFQTAKAFQDQSLLNRVMDLAMHDQMGILDKINTEKTIYDTIKVDELINFSKETFTPTNMSVLTIKAI